MWFNYVLVLRSLNPCAAIGLHRIDELARVWESDVLYFQLLCMESFHRNVVVVVVVVVIVVEFQAFVLSYS